MQVKRSDWCTRRQYRCKRVKVLISYCKSSSARSEHSTSQWQFVVFERMSTCAARLVALSSGRCLDDVYTNHHAPCPARWPFGSRHCPNPSRQRRPSSRHVMAGSVRSPRLHWPLYPQAGNAPGSPADHRTKWSVVSSSQSASQSISNTASWTKSLASTTISLNLRKENRQHLTGLSAVGN